MRAKAEGEKTHVFLLGFFRCAVTPQAQLQLVYVLVRHPPRRHQPPEEHNIQGTTVSLSLKGGHKWWKRGVSMHVPKSATDSTTVIQWHECSQRLPIKWVTKQKVGMVHQPIGWLAFEMWMLISLLNQQTCLFPSSKQHKTFVSSWLPSKFLVLQVLTWACSCQMNWQGGCLNIYVSLDKPNWRAMSALWSDNNSHQSISHHDEIPAICALVGHRMQRASIGISPEKIREYQSLTHHIFNDSFEFH